MKVVHVVRQYLPSVGGMEEVVRNLVQYQRSHTRYLPTVLSLDRVFREPDRVLPEHELVEGIAVHRHAYRGSERYPLCPQVLSAIRDADLVHVHGIDFFFDFLALTKAIHRKPLIASTHGGFFHTPFAQGLKRLYFQTITRTSALAYDRIIATSDNDGRIFRQICEPQRIRVIENGVDVQKFGDAASTTLQPALIYFGRWSANKGILEAMEVFANLCAQQTNILWRLIIAGREYDLHAGLIRTHAQHLNIARRVSIYPNPSTSQLRGLASQASYFICMSQHEGFGIAPIEAMSAGLSPLLSDIPPFRNLITSTQIGHLLDEPDSASKAQKIAQLHAANGEFANHEASFRKPAKEAAQSYAWPEVAERYTQQYDQVLAAA